MCVPSVTNINVFQQKRGRDIMRLRLHKTCSTGISEVKTNVFISWLSVKHSSLFTFEVRRRAERSKREDDPAFVCDALPEPLALVFILPL